MIYEIKNEFMTVAVDTLGAQLMSLRENGGREYLWQGDPTYWRRRSPILFPFIARLHGAQFSCGGKLYKAERHGFAPSSEFSLREMSKSSITLTLKSTPEIYENYPFDFVLNLTYSLEGRALRISAAVENNGDNPMFFAFGLHPGFMLPLGENEPFEEHYLEFSAPCEPKKILLAPDTLLPSGESESYPLKDGKIMTLDRPMFDNDAIILTDVPDTVTLKSRGSDRSVTVKYPSVKYVGFWQPVGKEAPLLCIEPWSSLPGRDGVTEEIDKNGNFLRLEPKARRKLDFAVEIN